MFDFSILVAKEPLQGIAAGGTREFLQVRMARYRQRGGYYVVDIVYV